MSSNTKDKDYIDYEVLLDKAVRNAILDVMSIVAEKGVPEGHRFFITFNTQHERNILPKYLKVGYHDEMTILIQKKYKNLFVSKDSIDVTLYFNGIPERLHIFVDSITAFCDPDHDFALKFGENSDEDDDDEFYDDYFLEMSEHTNENKNNTYNSKTLPARSNSKKESVSIKNNLIMLDRFRK